MTAAAEHSPAAYDMQHRNVLIVWLAVLLLLCRCVQNSNVFTDTADLQHE